MCTTEQVVELCEQYYRKVPVLVIASSNDELGALHKAVSASKTIPQGVVQRFSEFDGKAPHAQTHAHTQTHDGELTTS